jgi:hypothetical protein
VPKFYAKVPLCGHLWIEVEAPDAYTAEAEALTQAARLESQSLPFGSHLLKVTDSPLGRVVLVADAEDSP